MYEKEAKKASINKFIIPLKNKYLLLHYVGHGSYIMFPSNKLYTCTCKRMPLNSTPLTHTSVEDPNRIRIINTAPFISHIKTHLFTFLGRHLIMI